MDIALWHQPGSFRVSRSCYDHKYVLGIKAFQVGCEKWHTVEVSSNERIYPVCTAGQKGKYVYTSAKCISNIACLKS